MTQPANRKPPPARLPETDRPARERREDGMGKRRGRHSRGRRDSARQVDAPAPEPRAPARAPEPDEASVELEGSTWTVRVLGRAGSPPGGRAPPILLLGFWRSEPRGSDHDLEAIVVGRGLADLTPDRLAGALARAAPPRASGGRKPFFDVLGGGRSQE